MLPGTACADVRHFRESEYNSENIYPFLGLCVQSWDSVSHFGMVSAALVGIPGTARALFGSQETG